MIFKQLFEPDSCTYTYLIGCRDSGVAALIDPVLETAERDLSTINSMGLKLEFTVDTHIHADHLSGAKRLKSLAGSKICYPAMDQLQCADIGLLEGKPLNIGNISLHPLFTPGHTDNHHAYLINTPNGSSIFTGDALLINAVGRTDFQSGNPETLFKSIHQKFFTLPDETLVYPGHDYENRCVSSISQEKRKNPFIGNGISKEDFITKMNELQLPSPRKIDFAVPGNQLCGECPKNIPDEFNGACAKHDQG